VIHYEYPLSERIRTLLRLEDLFERFDAYANTQTPHSHQAALLSLFEIAEVTARSDLKSDLLLEMDRQKAVLTALRGNPLVEDSTLEEVVQAIENVHRGICGMPGKVGQHVREDEWLMSIKQRSSIPGGLCEFDLPSYHRWLHTPSLDRMIHLQQWLAPFALIRKAVSIILKLLRGSGQVEQHSAPEGLFQKMQEGRNPQLIRVSLAEHLPCVPEISANKYALNVRFVYGGPGQMRACTDQTISFELSFFTL
jgi:cell division protein ZapD